MSITQKSNRNAIKYRIVLLGDPGVGKSSIIQRYTTNSFDQKYNSTVGIDFNIKDVNRRGNNFRLQIWDTAGQQRFRSLITSFLKNAHFVIFVFDITNHKTLQNLINWYKLFQQNQQAPGIVVANKIDLNNIRSVSYQQATLFCQNKLLQYTQVSAKTGVKINQIFDTVIDSLSSPTKQNIFENNGNTPIYQIIQNGKNLQQKNANDKQKLSTKKNQHKCCHN